MRGGLVCSRFCLAEKDETGTSPGDDPVRCAGSGGIVLFGKMIDHLLQFSRLNRNFLGYRSAGWTAPSF